MSRILFLFLFVILFACKTTKQAPVAVAEQTVMKVEEEPVLSIGKEQLTASDLKRELETVASDSISTQEKLEQVLWRKRLKAEALATGYGDLTPIKEEIASYERILARSFITDSAMVENLAIQTYLRLKNELHTAHILIPVNAFASPQDTALAFQKINQIKAEYEKGVSFDSLALKYSADKNTKLKAGDMGWFSAMQMLYPLENAAYELKVGQVSAPVRSEAGYHLLKLLDKRAHSGTVTVKHILKAIPANSNAAFIGFQKEQIDSLAALLKAGGSFDEICSTNSDDIFSRENGGLLEPFSVGSRAEAVFEEAAFELKKGQISEPVRSSVGWHLIQLIDKKPLSTYEDLKLEIIDKITTDSRGEFLTQKAFSKYKGLLQFERNEEVLESFAQSASPLLLDRKWNLNTAGLDRKTLLTLGGENISLKSFADEILKKQSFLQHDGIKTADQLIRKHFVQFEKEALEKAILTNLKKWEPLYQQLCDFQKEEVLASSLITDLVYEKSVSDTLGQRQYFLKHREQYQWPDKALATIIKANKKELIDNYYDISQSPKPYRLKRGITPIYFSKEESELSQEMKYKLQGLKQILDINPSFIVEIGGHRDINESGEVSGRRINEAVEYLTKNGTSIVRIREFDYGTTSIQDRFDWSRNQRLTFQFFSNEEKDIAKILNNDTDTLEYARGYYFKGTNEFIDGSGFKKGVYDATLEDHFYLINIEDILPAMNKTLKECRGQVIADYQKELLKQLKEKLAVKYPVSYFQEDLKNIIKK